MAKAAPKAAPWETPVVKGEARGLRRMSCITAPATPSPAPARIAPTIRGNRMDQSTCWKGAPSRRSNASTKAFKLMSNEPTVTESSAVPDRTNSKVAPMMSLRVVARRYWLLTSI